MSARFNTFRKLLAGTAMVLVAGTAVLSAPALAQRDPAYAAARASGQIGELMDGYLGIVDEGSAPADLVALVKKLNATRKQIYFEAAQKEHETPKDYGIAAACKQILRTVPGEKYQAPDGNWRTRTSATPLLNAKCPPAA